MIMLKKEDIQYLNQPRLEQHQVEFKQLSEQLTQRNIEVETVLNKLNEFQIAIPSWALGAGGTRFGRYHFGGAPRNLFEKIEDNVIETQLQKLQIKELLICTMRPL